MERFASNRKRVLCVDDDDYALFLYRGLLRNEYDVELAKSGAEAVEYIESFEVDVVISDHRVPGVDGLSLARKIRTIGFGGPILINSDDLDVGKAEATDVTTHRPKRFLDLPRVLTELLE